MTGAPVRIAARRKVARRRPSVAEEVPGHLDARDEQVADVYGIEGVRPAFALAAGSVPLAHDDGVTQRFDVVYRRPFDLGLPIAGQRLFDGGRVEDGDRRAAMGAGVILADIDRRAATVAADGADPGGEDAISVAVNWRTKPFSIMNWAKVVNRPCLCRQRS